MSSANIARNNPQASQTTSDTQHNVRDAALRGASSAFSKPPVKPKPQANTYTGGNNGALLAATKVGTTGSQRNAPAQGSTSPLKGNWTGGSKNARPETSPARLLRHSGSSSTLGVPEEYLSERTPSPSNIAAKLAAARYSPMKPNLQGSALNERDMARLDSRLSNHQLPVRRASIGSGSVASTIRAPSEDYTDDTPIPPTTSLVSMFEKKQSTTSAPRSAKPPTVTQDARPPLKSPKPQRRVNLPLETQDDALLESKRTRTPPPVKPKPRTLSMDGSTEDQLVSNPRKDTAGSPLPRQKRAQLAAIRATAPRPKPPSQKSHRQPRPRSEDLSGSTSLRRRLSTSKSIKSIDGASSSSSFVSAPEEQEQGQEQEKPKPNLPPPRRSTKGRVEATQPETRPKTLPMPPKPRGSSKMKSPLQVPEQFARPPDAFSSPSPSSESIYHSNYQRESVKQLTKHLTGESLSSAIVGAALASSRGVSPNPPPPSSTATPPLPTRKHHHHHHHSPLHHINRSPSPQKPTGKLRTTMRKDPSSSSSEGESEKYKKKGTRIMGMRKKHPNKHHEGTRKRWRDAITERERKRYEGVWAANKGLHISTPLPLSPSQRSPSRNRSPAAQDDDPALDVLNLVIKEIWMRSRLPEHVLEEVWGLVDGRGIGRLRREEFVVGLWLIDQRLKGRKLPVRVSESVWGSVRGMGIKVKVRSHK